MTSVTKNVYIDKLANIIINTTIHVKAQTK